MVSCGSLKFREFSFQSRPRIRRPVVSMDDMERCLLVKQEVFVYKIPPRQSARGYRAADWNLSSPDWTGRLRIMEASKKVVVSIFIIVLLI